MSGHWGWGHYLWRRYGAQAFEGCASLTEVILPNKISEIGWCAFWGCNKINKLVLNKNLTKIAPSAFYGCHSLEVVQIPKSVKFVGKEAFFGNNLKEIIIEKDFNAPEIIPSGFENGWLRSKSKVKITFINV